MKVVFIISGVMCVIAVGSHVLAYVMEKKYKSKMNSLSNDK